MAGDSVGVYDIKTKLELDGEERHPASVALSLAINSYASLGVVHYNGTRAEDSAIQITNNDVYSEMGKRQQAMFSPRDNPDTKFSLAVEGEDADLDISFSGYIVNPSFVFSAENLAQADDAIDEFAKVDEFDLSIYELPLHDILDPPGKTLKDCGYNVPKVAMSIIKEFMEAGLPDTKGLDKESREAQDKVNQAVVGKIEQFFSDSEQTFGWDLILASMSPANQRAADTGIRNYIASVLKASTGSFLSTLAHLAAGFCCIIVPEFKGGSIRYKMVNRDTVYDSPENLEVPIVNSVISAGSGAGLFPMRYVAVVPAQANVDILDVKRENTAFIAYPRENMEAGGSAIRLPGPPWMRDMETVQDFQKSGEPKPEVKLLQPVWDTFKNIFDEMREQVRIDKSKILEQWAKSAYRWVSLEKARVRLTMPLLSEVSVGKRYSVRAKGSSKELFKGFCSAVKYSVVSQGAKSAQTEAMFTHVEMPGFELPGARD